MAHFSAEEAKAMNIAKMGEELGAVYTELWSDVVFLRDKWKQYVSLYGTSPERIDTLNRAAPHFFGRLDSVLWEDVVLHLARLTDRPTSFGKANLSIQCLTALTADDPCAEGVSEKVTLAVSSAAFARDWRNRHIAHRDRDLALEQKHVKPLEKASRELVWKALASVEDTLRVVAGHYLRTDLLFEFPEGLVIGDAEDLIHLLSQRTGEAS